jgi:hypothetical protein
MTWEPVPIPEQEPIHSDVLVKDYGRNWALGFEWLDVTLGGSRPMTGLSFYIKRKGQARQIYLCFSIREAVAFAERCKLPPKLFGRFMNDAVELGGDKVPQEFQIP